MRIRVAATACLIAFTASSLAAGEALGVQAFPGAEGFGADTIGGRGGAVLFVTNTNDSGPGSLREALEANGPRVVVFRTGGTITLNSPIVISNPYVIVAGQTAPGGGIQIRNNSEGYSNARAGLVTDSFISLVIDTHDVVIRYLRVRPGPLTPNPDCTEVNAVPVPPGLPPGTPTCAAAGDIRAIEIEDTSYNVVLDHLSLAWGSSNLVGIIGAQDVTLQRSIVSEGMNYVLYNGWGGPWEPFASKGLLTGHIASAQAGEITGRMSIHHNLWAHNASRSPQVTPNCTDVEVPEDCFSSIVNNITYNWRNFGLQLANTAGHHFSNAIGNVVKDGPDQVSGSSIYNGFGMNDWRDNPGAFFPSPSLNAMQVYLQDNKRALAGGGTDDAPIDCYFWNSTAGASGAWEACNPAAYAPPAGPFPTAPITTSPAADAFVDVLADAGANRLLDELGAWIDARDTTDMRVVQEVQDRAGSIIQDYEDFFEHGAWPTLDPGTPPADTDLDGMPDAWESLPVICLDPETADDDGDADGDVYTNIEEYLNGEPASPDADGDGYAEACDNCPTVANPTQADADSDGIGDACECAAGNTGLRNPTLHAADSGGDDNGFESQPTRAFADGSPGHASNNNGAGDRHRYYGYGVSIPPFCSVKGIEVRLDWWLDSASGTNSMSTELSWDGGASWTSARQTTGEPTSQTSTTLGTPTDTWGRAWTAAELSDASFRVRIQTNSSSSSRDFRLDWIPVRVTYDQ